MGGVADGTWPENDVEPAVDVVQAPHPIQQPLSVAEGKVETGGMCW